MTKPVKWITLTVALGIAAGVSICCLKATDKDEKHLLINVSLAGYNSDSQPVCIATFSNVSEAIVICSAYYEVDFITNGAWARTFYSEPGGTDGPFLSHQVSQKKFVLPRNAAAVRVSQSYKHVPAVAESVAAVVGKESGWKMAFGKCKQIDGRDSSAVLNLER